MKSTTTTTTTTTSTNVRRMRTGHKDFICGMGAAALETSITYPLNKLIFRQQLLGITMQQSFGQLRLEGVRFLYRGLLFPLVQKAASRSLMFGTYDIYRRALDCSAVRGRRFDVCHAVAAFLAGSTEAALTPFERVQVLMQNAKYHQKFRNTYDAMLNFRSYGVREYYRGLSMILVRNGLSNVLFFAMRDPLKEFFLARQRHRTAVAESSSSGSGSGPGTVPIESSLLAEFCSGAILGASLSCMFYPLNVIKARMQSKLGGEFEKPWAVLYKILQERQFSVKQLYRGVTLNFTRSLLTWGLTNAGFEFLERHLFR